MKIISISQEFFDFIAGDRELLLKRIVLDCQRYLDRYESEGRPPIAVDIDRIIEVLDEAADAGGR